MADRTALSVQEMFASNPYPGRGIIMGVTPDGTRGVTAYFIMGRSDNSRNRVFCLKDGALVTEPYDASKMKDPSLIIYTAVRVKEGCLIAANGDHSDTIARGLERGLSLPECLTGRSFEPDAPHFTPRISGLMHLTEDFRFEMSILRAADSAGRTCERQYFTYDAQPGLGRILHTYETDGDPLPAFTGDPRPVLIPTDAARFAREIWDALDAANRNSLYLRYTDRSGAVIDEHIINRHDRRDMI